MDEASRTAGTGIPGLDDIVRGGFPRGRVYVVEGDPGVGKTTLALQFLLEGRRQGERAVYISLSETKEELFAVATSHGWKLDNIHVHELAQAAAFHSDEQNTLFHPSEVELAETTKAVVDLCTRINPQRVVFDSLSEIRLLAQSPLRYRREVLALKQYFAGRSCTVLLLDDRTSATGDSHLQSIAHGVLSLEQLVPLYGAQRRRLRMVKLRGVPFRGGYHDFVIEHGGLRVFPRLVASEHVRPFERGAVSAGIPALDLMLGGGLDRGTSTLILGPAGAGKSTLATKWMSAAADRGERSALYAFDESLHTILSRSRSVGTDIEPVIQSGLITVRQIDPAEIPPGHFVDGVRRAVDEEGVRLVVIDSINGYMNAMPEESFLLLQMHELLTFLGQRGVVTILVMAQHGLVGEMISPTDVSYLADTVLLLRHFEAQGELKKAISVLKKRTGQHEHTIRELKLSSAGITAGESLTRFHGILTGVPSFQTGQDGGSPSE